MKKVKLIIPGLLCALFLFLPGCTSVTVSGDGAILKFKMLTIAVPGLIGLFLFLGGLSRCIEVLPERLRKAHNDGRRRIKTLLSFFLLPLAGIILMLLVVPFAWYKIEVNAQQLKIREFPEGLTLVRGDIKTIHIIYKSGKPAISRAEKRAKAARELLDLDEPRRIEIVISSKRSYFINESEIGTESFDKMVAALGSFWGTPLVDD